VNAFTDHVFIIWLAGVKAILKTALDLHIKAT